MNLYLAKIYRGLNLFWTLIQYFFLNLAAKAGSVFGRKRVLIDGTGFSGDRKKELVFLGEGHSVLFADENEKARGLSDLLGNPAAVFCYVREEAGVQKENLYNVAAMGDAVLQLCGFRIGVAVFDVGTMAAKEYSAFGVLKKLHGLRHSRADYCVAYVADSKGTCSQMDSIKKRIGVLGFDCVVGVEKKLKGKQNFRTNGFGETRICYSLGTMKQTDKEKATAKAGAAYKTELDVRGRKTYVAKEGYLPLAVVSSKTEIETIERIEKGQRFYLYVERIMKGFRPWNDLILMSDILDVIGAELPPKYAYLKNYSINQICARTYELAPGNVFFFRQAVIDKNDKKIESEFWRNRLVVRAFTRKSMFIFTYKGLLPFVPHMIIPDPLEAHIKVMAWYREKYIPAKYIGITGSIGKTSTKDMLYYVLKEKYKTERSKRNNNVQVKIALGMLNLGSDCEAFVQEIGGGRKYGASRHSRMILPDATIVTNIGTAHLGNYESQLELMEHKLMITDGMRDDGVLFLNGDDPLLATAQPKAKTVFFAVHNQNADFYADNIREDDGVTSFDIVHGTRRIPAKINVLGEYNVLNAVCACAVAKHLNLTDEEIQKGLLGFRTTGIRQNLISVGGYRFFVDCYNASLASVGSSLSVLRKLKPKEGGKRIAVVGDVTGVGEFQEDIDKEIAEIINDYDDIDCVVCFGARASYISQFLKREGKETHCIESGEEFKHWMTHVVTPQDVVMLKGSSKLKMDEKLDDYFGLNLSDQRYMDSSSYVAYRVNEGAYRLFADYASMSKYHGVSEVVQVEEQVLGKRVKKITDRAFAGNEYIEEVHIGKNVLHLGVRSFSNCPKLKKVVFPEGVKYIDEYAFANSRNIESLVLSKDLLHIGDYAFKNCKKLKTVYMPETVGFVGDHAFDGCNAEIKYFVEEAHE